MNEQTWHIFVWGWLRLFLGFVQVSLSAASFALLLTIGLHPLTWVFFAVATGATITSRLLYHGRTKKERH
jgi:hypothetical protein